MGCGARGARALTVARGPGSLLPSALARPEQDLVLGQPTEPGGTSCHTIVVKCPLAKSFKAWQQCLQDIVKVVSVSRSAPIMNHEARFSCMHDLHAAKWHQGNKETI
jgi:hypothetical protein